jgi:decaprenylphospho-beta-D-erythro-pentofuranosid-2-ulose 2-reductase
MNDAFGRPQAIVVLGGTSDIALFTVKLLVRQRCRSVVLAGRDATELEAAACRLRSSRVQVHTVAFDAKDPAGAEKAVRQSFEAAGEPVDLVLLAVGELGDQVMDESDPARVAQMVTVNFTWPAAALAAASERLKDQGHGRLVVLSSVAGVRIRRANYVYGATKAGLDAYSVGVAEALRGTPVSVHVVRPGFVRTKMTQGRPAAPLAIGAERVANDILRGLRRNRTVIWSPGILRWVYGALWLLPRAAWRRLPG